MLLEGEVVIIAEWADAAGTTLRIQDFQLQGRSFIPLFSDDAQFIQQMANTPFAEKGLAIDCKELIRRLHGDELLILNPGTDQQVQFDKEDFEPFL